MPFMLCEDVQSAVAGHDQGLLRRILSAEDVCELCGIALMSNGLPLLPMRAV